MPEALTLHWRKATRCQANGTCVELAKLPDAVAVRDSKNAEGAMLVLSRGQFRTLRDGIRNGTHTMR
jgi:hypothetical protein